ncbi:MAG TPA: hypothetical protein VMQ54_10810 [Steroidobacteraceae bacterium]|jgi:hypothetical protein|nr:hypothetical protein [Steroidobacteraceae bacterium]
MPNILIVKLPQGSNHIIVDETTQQNQLDPNKNRPQSIYWLLDDPLLDMNAQFRPIHPLQGNPGFKWVSPPPSAEIFDQPGLIENSTVLRIRDHHQDTNSAGSWSYVLWVSVPGGPEYHTVKGNNVAFVGGGDSPLIRNK